MSYFCSICSTIPTLSLGLKTKQNKYSQQQYVHFRRQTRQEINFLSVFDCQLQYATPKNNIYEAESLTVAPG